MDIKPESKTALGLFQEWGNNYITKTIFDFHVGKRIPIKQLSRSCVIKVNVK